MFIMLTAQNPCLVMYMGPKADKHSVHSIPKDCYPTRPSISSVVQVNWSGIVIVTKMLAENEELRCLIQLPLLNPRGPGNFLWEVTESHCKCFRMSSFPIIFPWIPTCLECSLWICLSTEQKKECFYFQK